MRIGLFIALLSVITGNALATDEAPQGITITGDREMPQVLYILPWKDVLHAEPVQLQLSTLTLTPVSPCDLDPNIHAQLMPWLDCTATEKWLQWTPVETGTE